MKKTPERLAMSDDLPDRLRVLATLLGDGDQLANIWGEQVAEAADEIDRLRAENKRLEVLLRQWENPQIEVKLHLYDPTQPGGDS